MVSKINFVNSIRALEILLKGAAILCFSPLVYIFEIREFGICTIADFLRQMTDAHESKAATLLAKTRQYPSHEDLNVALPQTSSS